MNVALFAFLLLEIVGKSVENVYLLFILPLFLMIYKIIIACVSAYHSIHNDVAVFSFFLNKIYR